MTTLSQMYPASSYAMEERQDAAKSLLNELGHFVRHSRSLASMMPALILSGVMALVITAVMLATQAGVAEGFVGSWMESWLTAWPIAFPVTYLVGPLVGKVTASRAAATARTTLRSKGLAFGDIAGASSRVTAKHGLHVLRLKPQHNFSAV